MAIPLTKRLGADKDLVSIRVKATEVLVSASALREIKTRPVLVAAHSVELSDAVLCTAAMNPPAHVPRLRGQRGGADGHPVTALHREVAGEFIAMLAEL